MVKQEEDWQISTNQSERIKVLTMLSIFFWWKVVPNTTYSYRNLSFLGIKKQFHFIRYCSSLRPRTADDDVDDDVDEDSVDDNFNDGIFNFVDNDS